MHSILERDPRFELLYLVGANGCQFSENVFANDLLHKQTGTARGRDWSARRWFSQVLGTGSPYITDVYRSAATDDFCFTVSVPVVDDKGVLVRVLGADARLSALL